MIPKQRNVKATWDEGWSGKGVNGGSFGKDDSPKPVTVMEQDNDVTVLFVEMGGEKFRVCRKHKVGF